jgi:uncharacterized damage-inducible protein DinB
MDSVCEQILQAFGVVRASFRVPLEGISAEHLNYAPSERKMSIGQIALHCAGAERYFMNSQPVFERTERTYVPTEYPIRKAFVFEQIDLAAKDIDTVLAAASDDDLEKPRRFYGDREVKLGYILMRVMTHELYHMGQMAYMRSWLDDDWHFDGFWGKAASAIIAVPYATTEQKSPGF